MPLNGERSEARKEEGFTRRHEGTKGSLPFFVPSCLCAKQILLSGFAALPLAI